MTNLKIKTVAIVGAGTMGAGIAQVVAMSGYAVILWDANQTALPKAKEFIEKQFQFLISKEKITTEKYEESMQRIQFAKEKSELVADLIIEAIIEKLEIKQELFIYLSSINNPETILATNTSSIPITQIAKGIENNGRVVGLHFFNPAQIMKLVEVIKGIDTDEKIAEELMEFARSLGKIPVMAADAPGFIVNRVARHYYVEALKILEENVTDFKSIDKLCKSVGFKMGPFELMDLIGVDSNFLVTSSMYEQFFYDPKFRPSRIQKQKVDAGHHGKKTKKGFYEYN